MVSFSNCSLLNRFVLITGKFEYSHYEYIFYNQIHLILECGPPRPRNKDANYFKSCPGNVGYDQKKDRNLIGLINLNAKNPKCLNGNKGYPYLHEAWKACGKIPECGFIIKDINNYYYLRRWSDPNMEVDPRVWGYNYYCRKYT